MGIFGVIIIMGIIINIFGLLLLKIISTNKEGKKTTLEERISEDTNNFNQF